MTEGYLSKCIAFIGDEILQKCRNRNLIDVRWPRRNLSATMYVGASLSHPKRHIATGGGDHFCGILSEDQTCRAGHLFYHCDRGSTRERAKILLWNQGESGIFYVLD